MSRDSSNLSAVGATTVSGVATVACVLPVFLTGAMAIQISQDLAFGAASLGVAIGVFRGSSAVAAVLLGRLADGLGAVRSLRLALGFGSAAALGISATAVGWKSLIAWLALAGLAAALGQPAANRLLANAVTTQRLGTAFGIKQSAPPAASMLAGACVPVVALTIGWRWAFLSIPILAVMAAIGVGRRRPTVTRSPRPKASPRLGDRGRVLGFGLAFGLGTVASSAATGFFVTAAVQSGFSSNLAGTVLAVASAFAIATRLVAGVVCDRMPAGHLWLCAALLAVGSVGLGLLAVVPPDIMAVAVVIALGGTWGFNGVFWFALVRAYPGAPGTITGAVAPGGALGGATGPILFGLIAEAQGFPAAWLFAGVASFMAAFVMALSAQRQGRP